MNTITHALIPVLTCSFIGQRSLATKSLSARQYLLIGILGAAPDLLNPHITLAARYASWSHSLWFWAALTMTLLVTSFSKKATKHMALLLSAAYFTHLVCDATAGGIAWNYPFTNEIVGGYFIPATWWIPLDVILILTAYFRFRLPVLKRNAS